MNKHLLVRSFGALLLANMGTLVSAQEEPEEKGKGDEQRRIRIEISRNENGHTSHITKEFDLNNEQELHDALRELGVLDELNNIGDGENVTLDLRRMNEDGLLNDMSLALAWPDVETAFRAPEPQSYLGVYYDDWKPNPAIKDQPNIKDGASITHVEEGSAAADAGLKDGDIVVDIGGAHIFGGDELANAVSAHEPGEKVKVTYYRGKQKKTTDVIMGSRPGEEEGVNWDVAPSQGGADWDWEQYFGDNGESDGGAFLGVVGGSDEENGVRIGEVVAGSAAEQMGVEEGDVLRSINGEALTDFNDLADHIGNLKPGDPVELSILRDGKAMMLKGNLGAQERGQGRSFSYDELVPPTPPSPPDEPMPPTPPMPPMQGWQQEDRQELRQEMDHLREEMDRLRRELRGGTTREMHVDISAGSIAQEDLELLKSKGVAGLDKPLELDGLQTYPEPGEGNFRVTFQVPQRGDLAVDVHNASGERIYHETISGFKGNYERLLDLSDQPDGTYFLVIAQGGQATARKLIKK